MKPRFLQICLSVLAIVATFHLASPNGAAAADDGGGRSVFSTGAGNRALGLGGAYAALSNDASAPLWNPGGLGLITRREFEITQTGYYGLAMDEQYASLVFPHWRWGTASLTFRHFGVDGIERRDDRNVLLQSDLSDSETEFLIGYGINLGTAWSVGGTIKLRRQSLAGFSATGVGVDLGVIVRPLTILSPDSKYSRHLSLGVSIRNALQPELQLFQERVPDPTGLRLGAAYLIPVFHQRALLVALDIEKTQNMDTRTHAGLEMEIHPLLTLRTGVNNGNFAAGTGVQWKGVAINYTFEQNEIENVHRVGATLTFGPSVEQSRQAALEAEENAMQAKFAAAFEKRQSDRVRELLDQADDARQRQDFDEALEVLAVATALEPGHQEALLLQAACLRELGDKLKSGGDYAAATVAYSRALALDANDHVAEIGIEKCRSESDRLAARSLEIRRQFAAALDAFSVHNLAKARDGFTAILRVSPDDREAATMLERTLKAIDHRVAYLLDQANKMIKWGHFDEAAAGIDEAQRLDPNARGVSRATAKLADARARSALQHQAQRTTETADSAATPEAAKTLSEEQRHEAERLYKSATNAMSRNESEEAIRYLELVWSIDPGYQRVAEHLKREYLTRGMEAFADSQLDRAVELWENALRIDPSDERTKGYLSRAREQASRAREILGQR